MAKTPPTTRASLRLPVDGIVVTDPAYGGVIDGQRLTGYATWTNGGTTLTVYNAAVSTSIAAGSKTLSAGNANTSGAGFQPEDVGKSICVPGAGAGGGNLLTTIASYVSGQQVILADAAVTALGGQTVNLVWPYLTAADVGKTLWLSDGTLIFGSALPPTQTGRGQCNTLATITAVTGPGTVTLGNFFGGAATGFTAPSATGVGPTTVVWGTDNTNAIVAAGRALELQGKRHLWYPANPAIPGGGIACAFGLLSGVSQIATFPDRRSSPAASATAQGSVGAKARAIHVGEAEGFFTSTGGVRLPMTVLPWHAGQAPPPAKTIDARAHLPRFTATATPIVSVPGDSWSPNERQNAAGQTNQLADISPITPVAKALTRWNRKKAITWNDFGIGGATFAWLNTVPASNATFPFFYGTRTTPWLNYVSATSPDLVLPFINGGNDGWTISPQSFDAVLQKIKGFPASGGGLVPDVLLVTPTPGGFYGGGGPNVAYSDYAREYAAGLIRSVAENRGYGYLDYWSGAALQHHGYDVSRNALRTAPSPVAASAGSLAPLNLRARVRDYGLSLTVPGASGSAAWAAVGSLAFQLSPRADNVAIVSVDGSGNLTVEANTYGGTAPATVTASSSTVSSAGQSSGSFSASITAGDNRLVINASTLTTAVVGQQILIPGAGANGRPLRTTIVDAYGSSGNIGQFIVADPALTSVNTTMTLTWGGAMFSQEDAEGQADITIAGAGASGGLYVGKITGFTDATHVTVSPAIGTALSSAANTAVFVGRKAVAKFSTAIAATSDTGANPVVEFSVHGTTLIVAYRTASMITPVVAYRGPVERFGAPFVPYITPANTVTLTPSNLWVDAPELYRPVLTDLEAWGWNDSSPALFDYAFGGDGGTHGSAHMHMRVLEPTVAAQNWPAI